jgi:hypothetical protein
MASSGSGFEGLSKWSHGAFVLLSKADPAAPSFYTLDRNGRAASSAVFRIPGASRVWAEDYDRGTDGTIVLCGGSYSADGRLAPFIGWISPDGQSSRIISTAPYSPTQVAWAPDGTIWTVGSEWMDGINPNANVMRHFSASGTLIASGEARSKFNSNPLRLAYGYLVAARDRIGWYAPTRGDRTGVYLEVAPDFSAITRYPGIPVGGAAGQGYVESLACTDAGNVFLAFRPAGKKSITYTLDRTTRGWVAVAVPPLNGSSAPLLVGNDGEQLVFRGRGVLGFFEVAP